jgi:endopeptidase La
MTALVTALDVWLPLVGLLDASILPGEQVSLGLPVLDQKGLQALQGLLDKPFLAVEITSRLELPTMVSSRWATRCRVVDVPSLPPDQPATVLVMGLARCQLVEVRGRQSPYEAKVKPERDGGEAQTHDIISDAATDSEPDDMLRGVAEAAALLMLAVSAGHQPDHPNWRENLTRLCAELVRACGDSTAGREGVDLGVEGALKALSTRACQLGEARQTMHRLEAMLRDIHAASAGGAAIDKRMRQRLWVQVTFIQKRLDIYDPLSEIEDDELNAIQRKLSQVGLPKEAAIAAKRQLKLLQTMRKDHHDYTSFLGQLQLMARLPWQCEPSTPLSIRKLQETLERDHAGLASVKRRILEYMAVLALGGDATGTVLCLAGPPGVGKTSLAKSIASALGKPLAHVALGGVHEESEIRGHRLSYVAASPGRIIDALARAGSKEAVMLLDEIDKLGGHRERSPAAALLEVLDPEQHDRFRDHYLGVPFDLSSVFFIATANDLATIPGPLRDRLEVIELEGYTVAEKLHIARQHLLPKIAAASEGLRPITISDDVILHIIEAYTREAGVRQLKRTLGTLYRAHALSTALASEPVDNATAAQGFGSDGAVQPSYQVAEDVIPALGQPRYRPATRKDSLPVGVAPGLGVIAGTGSVLWVEVARLPSDGRQGRLQVTGQLGDVMKESVHTVQALARRWGPRLGVDSAALRDDLHVHLPEAATPKDGPSAGIALFAAMLSAFRDKPLRADTAMTGELALSGDVWPVGGVAAKVLAAERAGFTRVILPASNRADAPETTTATLLWVSHVDDLVAHLSTDDTPQKTNA